MKKILSLVSVAALALLLAACGGGGQPPGGAAVQCHVGAADG